MTTKWRGMSTESRFWSKVRVAPADSCWEWLGKMEPTGYGRVKTGGRSYMAHRFAYQVANGAIPAGHQIHHTCENTACVNPAHLEAMTPRDHLHVGNTFQRKNAAKTHCPQGHPYAGKNLIIKGPSRVCRQCKIDGLRRLRASRALANLHPSAVGSPVE